MGLRKGKPVVVDQAAAQESTANVDLNVTDDQAPDIGQAKQPAPPAAAQHAKPPPPRDVETHAPVETEPSLESEAAARLAAAYEAAAPVQSPAVQQSSAMAIPGRGGNVEKQLAEAGFEGLNFGFGSFPIVSLQNAGYFESSEGGNLGQGFYCILFGSKAKWIFKNDAEGKDEDFCYSYDGETAVDGSPVQDHIDEWLSKGQKWEKKPYLDVQAQLVTDDEDNEQMVLLSIPKTSIPRFSGYTATMMAKGKLPNEVVTHVFMGDKVTKVRYPFRPWSFKFSSDCIEE